MEKVNHPKKRGGLKKGDPKTLEIVKKSHEARRFNAENSMSVPIAELPVFLRGKGAQGAVFLLNELMMGRPIKKEQREFLAYFKHFLPYGFPRLEAVMMSRMEEGSSEVLHRHIFEIRQILDV